MPDRLAALSQAGVSIWLDDLNRARLASGSLRDLVRDKHVVGLTSNPTIFQHGIGDSDLYDEQIGGLAARGVEVDEALREITTSDVRAACDVFRPVYEDTGGIDGRVSIEVDPRLAHDTAATIAEARHLWRLVDRPNLFVKIPGTMAGLPAITQCLAEGISINVTLIFSLRRYAAVIDAFIDGVARAHAAGHDLSRLASVASFFVSRVDTEIDQRLDKLETAEAKRLRGKAAIANARLAYQVNEQAFAADTRWAASAAAGAQPQRPLWASTGVKDPSYDDTRYVVDLVARGVVNTMPEATLEAVADHGEIRGDSLTGAYVEAAEVMTALEDAGIDYDDVVTTLERDGLATFEASWAELSKTLTHKLATSQASTLEKLT